MYDLLIETSTERGVIALGNSETVQFSQELPHGLNQSKYLIPQLIDALTPFSLPDSLRAIGVGVGPGSYTGIRIGVAVAQALAYSWKTPLIGVSSLYGFHPKAVEGHFGAIIDARIGGVYLLMGMKKDKKLSYTGKPMIYSLEEVGERLKEVPYLVTPLEKALKTRLSEYYPQLSWEWEERSPSFSALFEQVDLSYKKGEGVVPPEHLDILYLRETEAERKKGQRT